MTTRIVRAGPDDVERVLPLLARHFTTLTPDMVRALFAQRWRGADDPCGQLLLDGERVVGFIGHIFSRRPVDGVEHTFCNLSTWAVDPPYRSQGSLLLLPLFELARQGVTITDFTAAPEVRPLWERLRFAPVDSGQLQLPIVSLAQLGRRSRARVLLDEPALARALTPAQQALHRDHQLADCHHLLARSPEGTCYAVFTVDPGLGGLPTASFHHVGDRQVFVQALPRIQQAIFERCRTPLLSLPARFVAGQPIPRLSWVQWDRRGVYLSRRLRADQIDELYSELVLLR